MSFIQLDTAATESFLSGLGFSRTVSNNEVVFEKAHEKEANLITKVYTSIRVDSNEARDVGKDAVRISSLYVGKDKTYGIFRGKRVHRSGSQSAVQDRILSRLADASKRCDEWLMEREAKRTVVQQPIKNDLPSAPQSFSKRIGNLNEEMKARLTVIKRMTWNDKFLFTLNDNEGNVITYWSDKDLLKVDAVYDLRFVVAGWNLYRGVVQTNVKNVFGKVAS
jgi:hypothetical protein